MSASSKKKLRKEQRAAELTEKQLKQQAENKKLKTYSVTFIAVTLVVVIAAVAIFGITLVNRTGLIEKNTVAATVDGEEISSVTMNYYYIDAINAAYNEWNELYGDSISLYTSMIGLDLTLPLDEQVYDPETGDTWADYFYDVALEQVRCDTALCKKAEEEGFALSDEELEALESSMLDAQAFAVLSGYSYMDDYYRANYGNGASEDNYWEYAEKNSLAAAYYNHYADSLVFEDADLRAYEADKYDAYTSYSYASYYVSYINYLEGGTENEDGTIDYTEEEKDTARAKAKEVAEHLGATGGLDALDAAIAALPINADVEGASTTKYKNTLHSDVSSVVIDWLSDEARQEGDMAVLENTSTSEEESVVNGYYIVVFQGRSENLRPLANVRHILVSFESEDGSTTYTDEEKAAAHAEAEEILNQWKSGEATEESFIELVKEKSDDTGSVENGGLFEDITPEQGVYVEAFTDWAVDESRVAGDSGVIETEYGCHVMYYVGDSDINYRDYMITNDMREEAIAAWYDETTAAVTATEGNTSRLSTDLVINSGNNLF